MAAKDYEGTAAAAAAAATRAVSNFQRYYYFNPLSPGARCHAVPAADNENILHRGNFNCKSALFSLPQSISLRTALTLKNEIHSARCTAARAIK